MITTAVQAATESDFDFIKNLVPYYIYDMSEYMGWDPNREGRYDGCDELPDYWNKPDHRPYLITVDDTIAGFAMVRPCPDEPMRSEIGEFFILRKFRNHGIGRKSAYSIFDLHPVKWLVRVLDDNAGALRFWRTVIHGYTDGHVVRTAETYESPEAGTWPMQFFRFESRTEPHPTEDG